MSTKTGFVVTGGSGNVAPFVVQALLDDGATVAVPARSQPSADGLRRHLDEHGTDTSRLHTIIGDLSTEADTPRILDQTLAQIGEPTGVLAALGNFVTAERLVNAPSADLHHVLDSYITAHFMTARTFLPTLQATGGTYLMLQGPTAFAPATAYGANLVSIASAGQHMLFRALAEESSATRARVIELVIHILIRDRQTQPDSPYTAVDLGNYAARQLSGAGDEPNGTTIHLRSATQLHEPSTQH